MSSKRLDASWTAWLEENIRRGCNAEELLGILLANAFDIRSIRTTMGRHFPAQSPMALAAEGLADPVDYHAIANVRLTRATSGAVRFTTEKMQLYTLDAFMTAEECDEIVALINPTLRPSTVTIQSCDKAFRTSRTSDLSLLDSAVVS